MNLRSTALNWYRCGTSGISAAELQIFSGRQIDVPSWFIAGLSDWGIYQKPGEYEMMQQNACSDFRGSTVLPGAGHWVQQEQPTAVLAELNRILDALAN